MLENQLTIRRSVLGVLLLWALLVAGQQRQQRALVVLPDRAVQAGHDARGLAGLTYCGILSKMLVIVEPMSPSPP